MTQSRKGFSCKLKDLHSTPRSRVKKLCVLALTYDSRVAEADTEDALELPDWPACLNQ